MTIYHLQQEDVWQRHIKLLICNCSIHVLMQQPYNNIWWRKFDYMKMGRIWKNSCTYLFIRIYIYQFLYNHSNAMFRRYDLQIVDFVLTKCLISKRAESSFFAVFYNLPLNFYSYKLNFCFLPNFCLMWKRLIFYIYT